MKLFLIILLITIIISGCFAQSGKTTNTKAQHVSINVIVQKVIEQNNDKDMELDKITNGQIVLYEAGIQQQIESFQPNTQTASIVLLIDNTKGIELNTTEMASITKTIIGELSTKDRIMIVGYDQSAEILETFTNNSQQLVKSTKLFRKKSSPCLYDAIVASIEDGLHKEINTSKLVIILISDGYDTKSKASYDYVLNLLQSENILLYAIQIPDRTFGAPRNQKLGPKPPKVLTGLAEGSGGRIFTAQDIENAAKIIADEIDNKWYKLTYIPKGINILTSRRLLVSGSEDKFIYRTKKQQPPQNYGDLN